MPNPVFWGISAFLNPEFIPPIVFILKVFIPLTNSIQIWMPSLFHVYLIKISAGCYSGKIRRLIGMLSSNIKPNSQLILPKNSQLNYSYTKFSPSQIHETLCFK